MNSGAFRDQAAWDPRNKSATAPDDFGRAHGRAPGVIGSVESDDDGPRALGHCRNVYQAGSAAGEGGTTARRRPVAKNDTGGIWSIGLLEPIRHAREDDARLEQQ